MQISVRHDIRELTEKVTRAQREIIPAATVSALNRTADQTRTIAVRAIAEQTGLQQKVVRLAVLVQTRARRQSLTAIIEATRKGVNLVEFLPAGQRRSGAFRRQAGITANVWGKSRTFKGTFLVTGKSSGKVIAVTRRPGARRQGRVWQSGWSKTIYGPSIPKTFAREIIRHAMEKTIGEKFPANFEHELQYRLSRL